MKKIRFGVIGAGGIASRRTIPGMLLSPYAELVAVMGPDLSRTESVRRKFGALRAYDSEMDLLSDEEIDAVYIASPVVHHARQARLAADAGKHILLEKPIAMTCKEASEVLDYCERKNVQVAAGLMMRFGTQVRNMKKAVAEGHIGQIVSGYSQFTLWLPGESGNWRIHKSLAGGGCMMDMGVHTIDLVEYITGMKIVEVASMNDTITFDYDVEDTSTLLLRLENGAQVTVQTNFNIPDEAASWRIELFGTKGRLLGDTMIGQDDGGNVNALFLKDNSDYDPAQVHNQDKGTMLSGNFGNLYTREIDSFCLSLLENHPLEVPAKDALHIQEVMEAAYRSSAERTFVACGQALKKEPFYLNP